ncbi:nucleotidyltransferase [Lacticaseibacillus jixianensis]|uniref:tRNA(Met) cytidine acetate ligase n=1 Tax=Lacticaseibacillus jixianensis TaxID=2486012 RepID=A0ABW4B9I0_9LACO|nr:nucleotidyltransferase [Lacticaseibacillus jixianensis]
MQAVGMIAEFNPLHNGHVFALQAARRLSGADAVVVLMAGNFVQRGEPAIVDKWHRANAALAAGADLVVELPTTDAVQAADGFAAGSLALLSALHVQSLAFGTEAPGLDYAALAARVAAAPPQASLFADHRETYATQLNQYYQQTAGVSLDAPNLLLGLSYAQANRALKAPLTLLPFARQGAAHDAPEMTAQTASASALRAAVAAGQDVSGFMPQPMAAGLAQARRQSWDDLFPLLRYRLQTADLAALRAVYTMSEGLEFRLTEQLPGAADFADFLQRIKSKRYTYARMRRLCLYVVLNLTQAAVQAAAAKRFLHVLGFNQTGRRYLHQVKKTATLPLITKVSSAMLAPGGLMYWQHRCDQLIETLTGTAQNFGRVPLMRKEND